MRTYIRTSLLLTTLLTARFVAQAQPTWPAIKQQTKPWTRWWWMGSAVNDKDLTRLLEQYQKAGLGGVEITPIYGVKGEEKQFINFLSPTWMDRLTHSLTEAGRLGMGVDLAQASGWLFGGPWVTPTDACKYVTYQQYTLKAGERLNEPVHYTQKPIVRTVGEKISLDKLIDPIARNPDLQLHAFDQVRFEKPLPLQTLMAYPEQGPGVDLTTRVNSDGTLNWTAPGSGTWTLYAVFQGWHGKQVERAGPGGEGDVIDHFSKTATQHYLTRFDQAFKGKNVQSIRAFFNDSYEVDDAQGEGNWTPALFSEFAKRRGYDLKQYLPALFGKATDEQNQRVLSDYRETIAELLLENYTRTWHDWAHGRGQLIRNQAHGSPANILDLYAETDIPEIEGTDLLRIKFASSAAHVTGKKLASSESATWDNEHFLSTLSDIKKDMDRFLLGGVNHTFYHGTNYSPQTAAWPGWLFYAAVHFNPNNSFWTDFGKLNQYVTRCQSFLQLGKPDNDVLVYLPIYDAYSRPVKQGNLPALLQHFDGMEHGFNGLPVEKHAGTLLTKGYSFDFISDKQVLRLTASNGQLLTGGITYQTILIPDARIIPLPTLQQLMTLARNGATIAVVGQLPTGVPGLGNLPDRQQTFRSLLATLKFADAASGVQKASIGKGSFLLGNDTDKLLAFSGVKRETMVDMGLQTIRRSHATGHYQFIVNESDKAVNGWVPLVNKSRSATLFNPMTEQTGVASLRSAANGNQEVYLQLAPGETVVLALSDKPALGNAFAYQQPTGAVQALTGSWQVRFVSGGPGLPASLKTDKLQSWTEFGGDSVKNFSGSAEYTLSFPKPDGNEAGYLLDLGKVAQSARIRLNDGPTTTLIGPAFQLFIPSGQLKATNTLTITVSNSMANRISDLDRRRVVWRKFYNINMSARLRENRGADGNFTAEKWKLRESGLMGPVTLTPIQPFSPASPAK